MTWVLLHQKSHALQGASMIAISSAADGCGARPGGCPL